MSMFSLRATLAVLAAAMALSGGWIIATELLSLRLPYFPANAGEAADFGALKPSATRTANLGQIRGDLWTVAAVTEAAPLIFGPPAAAADESAIKSAEQTAMRAAKLSPHDARNWLVLSALRSRIPQSATNATEPLKLSYYTGPTDFALAPLRLAVAASLVLDEELQGLVESEIERILLKRPALKPAIAAAYRAAIPQSRPVFEAALKEADPAFLATLKGTAPPR